jgi:type III secretion protein J
MVHYSALPLIEKPSFEFLAVSNFESKKKYVKTTLKRCFLFFFFFFLALFLCSCESNKIIVNNLDEREANEIIVFLASKGIEAEKIQMSSTAPGGGTETIKYSLAVKPSQSTEAMALLNQNGLPRIKGTNLLDLFAKAGLMSTEKEETIRYQAGLAEQIANMIRKIDGVIDADVQLSFPAETAAGLPGTANAAPKKITAAIYVKHQGILDDPNSHLIIKIKRLVAGSVTGLDINDVAVISDRSRFTDITLIPKTEALEGYGKEKEYVSIWSIIMSKNSAGRFRLLFFSLMIFSIVFALIMGWLIWKFYLLLKRRGGFKNLLHPAPLQEEPAEEKTLPEEEK